MVKLASFTAEKYLAMFLMRKSGIFFFLNFLTNDNRDQIKLADCACCSLAPQDHGSNTSKLEYSIKNPKNNLPPLMVNIVEPVKQSQEQKKEKR